MVSFCRYRHRVLTRTFSCMCYFFAAFCMYNRQIEFYWFCFSLTFLFPFEMLLNGVFILLSKLVTV
jgi:hypothetical protein